ncbi:MAG: radical SAM family heme chaperone HemW [Bacilli bacterium]
MKLKTNKIKSLYIHIPFCEHICSYCDFTKIIRNDNLSFLYILDLLKSLKGYIKEKKKFSTIYIGGGTPTCIEPFLLNILLSYCTKLLKTTYEFTVEANVESINKDTLRILKNNKVNRLSIGVQTFSDELLLKLNRKHTGKEAINAVNLAFKYINNINIDLMYGFPFSSFECLKTDLEIAKTLPINHISTYSLLINKGTLIYNQGYKEVDGDTLRKYFDFIKNELKKTGFKQYEVSNFSKPGYYSRNNITYWKNEEYIGLGAGSSGFENKVRYTYTKNINSYLYDHKRTEEIVTVEDDIKYQIFLNLRTTNGIDRKLFKEKFGFEILEKFGDFFTKLQKKSLIKINKNTIKCTYNGLMILDNIILEIF